MKSPFQNPRASFAALTVASVLALLAACGGGGTAAEPAQSAAAEPTQRPLTVSGTVTGFGSVIIDGVRYDDTLARISVDNGTATGKPSAAGDLKLGMSVDARVEAGKLTDVTVRAALAGPIGSIDGAASSFTIYGQTVKVLAGGPTPTLFEGVADLAGLALNDRVEVHGTVDAVRAITATRVERKPREASEAAVRVGGVVTHLDTAAKTFRFNDLTVDFSGSSVTPAGQSLTNGQLVVAFGDSPPAAGRFAAKALRIKSGEDGAPMAIGGRITAYVSLADFTVAGLRVNAEGAAIEGGTAADLVLGASVAAEGTVTGGVLKASKLRVIKTSGDALASLKGEISEFLSASSFKLRGATVDASAAAFVNGKLGDLGNGAWVATYGSVRGDVFKADKVEFLSPPVAQAVKLSGEMRDWDAGNGIFKLMAMTVKLAQNVQFDGGTAERLANGRRVAVIGVPDAQGVVVANKLAFLPELAAPAVAVVGGRAYDVAAGTFKLPGFGVNYTSATVFEGGTAADVANGVLVLAKGNFDAASKSVNATWIEVVKGDIVQPRVAGPVSEFVSLGNFRIGSQKIDASSAAVVDGQASQVGNGVVVLVTGNLVDRDGTRVLVATTLRLMQ